MTDLTRINIDKNESVDMNYDILKSTFFNTFNDIKDYLNMQIPMREKQINWMMTFEDRYFVLTEGPERKHAPYEYMVFVMEANTHEQVMIVLWNHDEPDPLFFQ